MANYLTIQIRLLVAILAVILPFSVAKAETNNDGQSASQGLYVGTEGGVAFGACSFSSFGADKTHPGYVAGLFVGYRINPIFSVELDGKWGNLQMSARQSCIDANYWLSADGNQYAAEVLGMDGEYYANLKSSTYWNVYGLRVNVNVLGLVPSLRNSRWRVELSPQVSVWGSRNKYKYKDDGTVFTLLNSQDWHFGYGGNLQASYFIGSRLTIGVYSGLTFLNGDRLDSLPKTFHKNNFIWDSGIRMSYLLQ